MNCSYGCGNPSIVRFKTGNYCCSSAPQKCPAVRQRNANAQVGNSHSLGRRGQIPWNKGLTRNTDVRVSRGLEKTRQTKASNPEAVGFGRDSRHSADTKNRISSRMKEVGGGYRPGSGAGFKGSYRGIYCDSTWELAFLLWCEHKKYKVLRSTESFTYEWNGRSRKYYPDFLCRGRFGWRYVEVKGFVNEQWEAKKRAFPHDLVLVDKTVMTTEILPLVTRVYGSDFVRLYEQ